MGDNNLRDLARFCYKDFSTTGRKVPLSAERVSAASMGSERVIGQLDGLLFQIGETIEELNQSRVLSISAMNRNYDELKQLRVDIYSLNSELKLLQGKDYDDGAKDEAVQKSLSASKLIMGNLQQAVDAAEEKENKTSIAAQNQKQAQEAQELNGRKFAYEKVLAEIVHLLNDLTAKYNTSADVNITKELC